MTDRKIAAIFPGQGAQYVGMGKDFYDHFLVCKETFEEADDILGRSLSKIVFGGNEALLLETKNSQAGIYVMSLAIYRLLQKNYQITPTFTGGLSLGEYSALTAANKLSFKETLLLVQKRGELMNKACEETKGSMAVILGLSAKEVEQFVLELNLPEDLYVANFNCPGQVVISGTEKGILAGSSKAKEVGAKRVVSLPVSGAFHSGLMLSAQKGLVPYVEAAAVTSSDISLVMNVTGKIVSDLVDIKKNMIAQVTSSVRWEMSVEEMAREGATLFIEMGPGKTLAGMNKKIGVLAPTVSIEKMSDLTALEALL